MQCYRFRMRLLVSPYLSVCLLSRSFGLSGLLSVCRLVELVNWWIGQFLRLQSASTTELHYFVEKIIMMSIYGKKMWCVSLRPLVHLPLQFHSPAPKPNPTSPTSPTQFTVHFWTDSIQFEVDCEWKLLLSYGQTASGNSQRLPSTDDAQDATDATDAADDADAAATAVSTSNYRC